MFERDIYTIHSTYREDMRIKGFQFGKGEKSACIVGAARGNEIQQMYICSQLVKALRELGKQRLYQCRQTDSGDSYHQCLFREYQPPLFRCQGSGYQSEFSGK